MLKIKGVWRDFVNNFFSKRLLVFAIFQITILHYYVYPVKQISAAFNYPATPWILPFLGSNVYFIFIYGVSVVYFYSNVPFMQRHELYGIVRMGRGKWFAGKMIQIWLSAIFLAALEWGFSILLLFPRIEWIGGWGKLFYSLSLTEAGTQIPMIFSYGIIQGNTPAKVLALFLGEMVFVTGLVGSVMFAVGVWLNRTVSALIGTAFSVLAIVYANIGVWQGWIGYISIFSWLDVLLLMGKETGLSPTYRQSWIIGLVFEIVLCVVCYGKIKRIDFNWTEEE